MRVTKEIAKRIILEDDATENGGAAFAGYTLSDFIEEANLRYGYPISRYNIALHECGFCHVSYLEVKKNRKQSKRKGMRWK